jgi:hypothetical protein
MSTAAPIELADDVLRAAHAAAYRFPAEFAGFRAELRTYAGDSGAVMVTGSREVTVDLPAGAAGAEWARGELSSIIGHRWPTRYEEGDGRWRKRLDGDRIAMLDDPYDSSYRVTDGVIAEVHRTTGDIRFSIVIGERVPTVDGRWLPSTFMVVHWNVAEGRLVRADQYRDQYARVGEMYLPSRREVSSATDDGLVIRAFELSGHEVIGHA